MAQVARQYHHLRVVRLGKEADSMEPTIHRGSIVIIDPTEATVSPKPIHAVRLDEDGACAIKRVSQTDGHWVLVSDNSDYDPIAILKTEIPNIIIGREVCT
jgi:phage repressor protein C with HTH and peptisase S24 domain